MRLSIDDKPKGSTYTVLLDGKDISNRCYEFDTIEGWVDCYIRDDDGKLVVTDTFEVSRERLFGDVFVTKDIIEEEEVEKAQKEDNKAANEYFEEVGAKK